MFARFSQLFPSKDESKEEEDGKPIFRASTSFNSEPEPEVSNPRPMPDWPLEMPHRYTIEKDEVLDLLYEDDKDSVTSARVDMEEVARAPTTKKVWRGEQDIEEQGMRKSSGFYDVVINLSHS